MFVASGSTDRKVPFVAVDATDLKTRETGLSSFTVYRSRDGGAATAYTTPTVAEASAANMPGLYWLTLDEDTTIAAGHDEEQYVVHITQASMAPVTLAVTLYRAIADAVWDELAADHTTTGTFGEKGGQIVTVDDVYDNALLAVQDGAPNAVFDAVDGVETGLTFRQWLRLSASALFGKASGLDTTTAVFRDFGDTKARITATVDASGNRTAVTTDAT